MKSLNAFNSLGLIILLSMSVMIYFMLVLQFGKTSVEEPNKLDDISNQEHFNDYRTNQIEDTGNIFRHDTIIDQENEETPTPL